VPPWGVDGTDSGSTGTRIGIDFVSRCATTSQEALKASRSVL